MYSLVLLSSAVTINLTSLLPLSRLYVPLPITLLVFTSGVPIIIILSISFSTSIEYVSFSLSNVGTITPSLVVIDFKYVLSLASLLTDIVYVFSTPDSLVTFILIVFIPTFKLYFPIPVIVDRLFSFVALTDKEDTLFGTIILYYVIFLSNPGVSSETFK